MKTSKMIELAILGSQHDQIACNIAAMNPSLIIAERIVSGLPIIDFKKVYDKLPEEAVITETTYSTWFQEDCLHVTYKYPSIGYFTEELEVDGLGFVNGKSHNFSSRQSETYKYKYQYWNTGYQSFIPEDVAQD